MSMGRGSARATDSPAFDMREFLTIVFKYKYSFVIVILVGLICSFCYLILSSGNYVAETKLLVRIGREKFTALEQVSSQANNVLFQEREQNVNNEIEIIRDPKVMADAFPILKAALPKQGPLPVPVTFWDKVKVSLIEFIIRLQGWVQWLSETIKTPFYALGISQRMTPDERLRDAFTASMGVEYIKSTDVIVVSFGWDDPQFAAFAANTIVDIYRGYHIRVQNADSVGSSYQLKLDAERQQLARLDGQIAALLKSSSTASFDIEKELDLGSISELERQLEATQISRRDVKGRSAKLEAVDATTWVITPSDAASVPAFLSLDQRYVELGTKRNELISRFRESSPEIKAIDFDIASITRQKIEALRSHYEVIVRELDERAASLSSKISERRNQVVSMAGDSFAYQRLSDERKAVQDRIDEYRRKVDQINLNATFNDENITSFSIIAAAEPPTKVSGPSKSLVLMITLFVACLLSFIHVTLRELLREDFRGPADVQRGTGLSVLAIIPHAR